jgi:mRNA interferase MazF
MEKDFDHWNIQKKTTNARESRAPFKEGDVWWCSLGANVGDEQDGKGSFFSRPVLVFKKFNRNIFLGVPLSTIIKDNRFYHQIHFKGRAQCVVLSQIRLLDAKRLENRMGDLPSHEFEKVKQKLKELVF